MLCALCVVRCVMSDVCCGLRVVIVLCSMSDVCCVGACCVKLIDCHVQCVVCYVFVLFCLVCVVCCVMCVDCR